MAAKKVKAAIKRRASPMIGKLKNQLQKAQGRALVLRKEAKAKNSPGATLVTSAVVGAGGGVAGVVNALVGEDWGRMASGGGGVALVLLGAFGLPGAAGSLTAATGAGMLAKAVGDYAEDMASGLVSGEDGEEEAEEGVE